MFIRFRSLHVNFTTVMSIFCVLLGVLFAFLAAGGIVVAVTFFSKIFIILSLISFVLGGVLFFLRKSVKVK
uniref:Uncharacterized protein n=1 Tax=Candidatus Berkiella aquae TaxID=295108 RepID=A0A0Q9Z0C2_9GAMM